MLKPLQQIVHVAPIQPSPAHRNTKAAAPAAAAGKLPTRRELLPITKTSDFRGYELVPNTSDDCGDPSGEPSAAIASSTACKAAQPYRTECRFDDATLALANAVVSGDITFDEALSQSYLNIPSGTKKKKANALPLGDGKFNKANPPPPAADAGVSEERERRQLSKWLQGNTQ